MAIIKKPMLSATLEDTGLLQWPQWATEKLDGIRCLRVDNKTLSRTFLPIPNRHIQKMMADLPCELDGELMIPGGTFNQVQSAVMSEDGEPNFRFHVFDFVTDSLITPYVERMANLAELELPWFCEKIIPEEIKDMSQLSEYEDKCLERGFEGVMLRTGNSPYKCGRSTEKQGYLVKLKRFMDSEAEIVGFTELMSNQNEAEQDNFGRTKRSSHKEGMVPAGTLGKLIVREIGNTPWKGKEFGVGSGFDQLQRQQIWDNRPNLLGKIITYKFQPHGIKDLPRLPIWKGFRSTLDM